MKFFFIPFLTLFWRESLRFLSVGTQTLATPLIRSSLYILVFGIIKQEHTLQETASPYLHTLLCGLITMGVITNAFENASSSLVISKFQGESEILRVSPFYPWQLLWGMCLGSCLRGWLVGMGTFFVGMVCLLFYGLPLLSIQHIGLLCFFLFFSGFTFAALGVTTGLIAKSFDQISSISTFLLLPLIYLGGTFFSLDELSPFWQMVSKLNPLLYFINGMKYSILGKSDLPLPSIIGFTLLCFALVYWIAFRFIRLGSYTKW